MLHKYLTAAALALHYFSCTACAMRATERPSDDSDPNRLADSELRRAQNQHPNRNDPNSQGGSSGEEDDTAGSQPLENPPPARPVRNIKCQFRDIFEFCGKFILPCLGNITLGLALISEDQNRIDHAFLLDIYDKLQKNNQLLNTYFVNRHADALSDTNNQLIDILGEEAYDKVVSQGDFVESFTLARTTLQEAQNNKWTAYLADCPLYAAIICIGITLLVALLVWGFGSKNGRPTTICAGLGTGGITSAVAIFIINPEAFIVALVVFSLSVGIAVALYIWARCREYG